MLIEQGKTGRKREKRQKYVSGSVSTFKHNVGS
jgi:hypothetical protein